MDEFDAIRATHASWSPRFLELLERAEHEPELLARDRLDPKGLPERLAERYAIGAWPVFVGGDRRREIQRVSVEVASLVRSVPERIFGDRHDEVARFYGLPDARLAAAILEGVSGADTALARGDFYDTPDGLQCMEVNLSSCLGGWQLRFFIERMVQQSGIDRLVDGDGRRAVYVDPIAVLSEYLVDRAVDAGLADDGEVHVAFLIGDSVRGDQGMPLGDAIAELYEEILERRGDVGGSLRFVGYDQVRECRDGIEVDGRRIHVAVEYHGPATHQALFRRFKAGQLHLYNGPIAFLLRDKRNLALLSEHQESDLFDPAERRVIERHIPWTRVTRPGVTRLPDGGRGDLEAFALEHRDELVLKPGTGLRGDAVLAGWSVDPERWGRALGDALAAGSWVLQRRIVSRPYGFPDGGEVVPHDLVWGLFAFGDRYGGSVLRLVPQGTAAVVNNALGAALGIHLEVED